MLDGYAPPEAGYDELLAPDGTVREPWRGVLAEVTASGPAGLLGRRLEIERLLRAEGVTTTVVDRAPAASVPVDGVADDRQALWSLDPLPLVIDSDTWRTVETGVSQRAALCDLVLADCYGPRRLLGRGLIPPEFVFANPGFLRPCDGATGRRPHSLMTWGIDVARGPRGELRAVGDHAQAPSGLGYALVNRSILSRVLPVAHRSSGVERLAGFVRAFRAGIHRAAPVGAEEPQAAVLTSGPHSELYFEHTSLAAGLGLPLVEGRDLEVRDDRLWIRSLTGRHPVDVLVRRLGDTWCDPVELRADSVIGVPGLLHAVRQGRVAVTNPIGVGLLEHRGLAGLLGPLARALLGEDLVLRGPESWWCGSPTGLSHVLAHLDRLVLHLVDGSDPTPPIAGDTLSTGALRALRDRVRSRPGAWVGCEPILPSTTPTVGSGGVLESRPFVLRTFLTSGGDADGPGSYGYTVLPGGLARVGGALRWSGTRETHPVVSKDTWVIATDPAPQQSTWLRSSAPGTTRGSAALDAEQPSPLPARSGARLFVLGRALEHAEGVIRLIRTIWTRIDQPTGSGGRPAAQSLSVLIDVLTTAIAFDAVSEPAPEADVAPDPIPWSGFGRPGGPDEHPPTMLRRAATATVLEVGVRQGLAPVVEMAVQAAYALREQLSADSWQLVGDLDETIPFLRRRGSDPLPDLQSTLERLLRTLLALAGLAAESMERDQAWHALEAGRRLERARSTTKLIRSLLVDQRAGEVEDLLLESALKASESLIVFRRRNRASLRVPDALDLLIYDRDNPRSTVSQLDRLVTHLRALAREPEGFPGSPGRPASEAISVLERTDAARLAAADGTPGRRRDLDLTLGRVDVALATVLDRVRGTLFSDPRLSPLAPPARASTRERGQGGR